jgi:hypothetical protein
MTQPLERSPEDAALDRDPSFRREMVDEITEAAQDAGICVDGRCRRLLERYALGAISRVELHHEIGRPVLH